MFSTKYLPSIRLRCHSRHYNILSSIFVLYSSLLLGFSRKHQMLLSDEALIRRLLECDNFSASCCRMVGLQTNRCFTHWYFSKTMMNCTTDDRGDSTSL